METLLQLQKEFSDEYETTKNFFENYPSTKNDFSPHEKSMKMMSLATHIAEIFGWAKIMLETEKLDFAAGDYMPTILHTKAELQQKLEDDYLKNKETLAKIKEEDLEGRWTMNMGETVLMDFNKYEALRHALNQIVHHRAQLGVYYRLNDITLPGSYGPSADVETF